MKTRTLTATSLLACASLCSCGTSSDGDAPYAFSAGVERVPIDGGVAATSVNAKEIAIAADFGSTPDSIAHAEAQGVLVLSSIATMLSTVTASGAALDATKAPEVVAAALAANLATKLCPGASAPYQSGTPYFTINLGAGCALGGTGPVASGSILVGLTGTSTSSPWVAVAFTFASVVVNGHTVDGYASISTGGSVDTLSSRVVLEGLGTIAFDGTISGDATSTTLTGVGSWYGAQLPPNVSSPNGWSCGASAQSALGVHALHTMNTSCLADSGTIAVTRPYACTQPSDAGAAAATASLVATSSVSFLTTTPSTSGVTVTLTGPPASLAQGATPATATLPACIATPALVKSSP